MPMLGLAIGAGLGLLKAETVDREKEKRQRELAAATQKYSPWTGLHANQVQEADPFGSALQYGGTGASMGVGIQSADSQNAVNKAMADRLNSGGSLDLYGKNLMPPADSLQQPNFGTVYSRSNSWGGV